VSLYVTHLLLDTVFLCKIAVVSVHLWLGITETTGEVRLGAWSFTYLVACYCLELTWRHRINQMLAVHHIGTIAAIVVYAGELAVSLLPPLQSHLRAQCTAHFQYLHHGKPGELALPVSSALTHWRAMHVALCCNVLRFAGDYNQRLQQHRGAGTLRSL
jgi:hypothetical protein